MKSKHLIFVFLVFLFWNCSKNKSNAVAEGTSDSLSIYLNLIKDNNLDSKKKIDYINKAYDIVSNQENDLSSRERLKELGNNFYNLGEGVQFKNSTDLLLTNAIDAKDTINIGRAYKNLGRYHLDMGQNDSSFYYCLKAEKISLQLTDSLLLGDIYLDKAFIQLYESDFSGCEISASKALSYINSSSNKFNKYDAYNLIGVSSNQLKNYERALEYHYKALNYFKENDLKNKNHLDASSLNNIGYVYQNTNRHKEAISAFNLALKDKTLFKDNPGLYAMLIDNLAYSKFKLKDYSQLPNLFFQSLKIRDSLNTNSTGIILNKIHLSEFYDAKRDVVQAQFYAKEALADSRKSQIPADILVSLKQLSAVEHKNAAIYSKEYIQINDSLQIAERKNKDKFARIAYETDEIIIEKDKLAEQNRNLFYLFIGIVAMAVLLFVIRAQRAKNRELLLKQQQQLVNEEIYNLIISQQATIEENRVDEKKKIARELHDGVLGRMFGARLNLDSLNNLSDPESIKTRFNYLTELKKIEQDIREISHDLSAEKHYLVNNFVAIVDNLIKDQKISYESEITLFIDESIPWDSISNTIKINLYRILQESLQNINKYASAKNIRVDLKKDIDNVILKIVDDGIGFQVNGKKKGIGLQNMLSRTHECNGVFDINSKKGKGTTIIVTIPKTNTIKSA